MLCLFFTMKNQRTSGPVNAHLIPSPGIYFNAFIYVYSPRAGADNPLGTNVDVNRKPLSFCPIFVAGLKNIALKSNFLYTIFSYFTIWATSWQNQQNGMCTQWRLNWPGHPASLIRVFAVSMKKAWALSYPLTAQRRLWSDCVDAQADQNLRWMHMPFCWVLSWGSSIIYIAPGSDRQSIGDKILMTTERLFLFAHMLQVSKWSLRNLNFIHVYSPGARAENPLGTNFWCQQKALITSTICWKFQTNFFEFWFYTHF